MKKFGPKDFSIGISLEDHIRRVFKAEGIESPTLKKWASLKGRDFVLSILKSGGVNIETHRPKKIPDPDSRADSGNTEIDQSDDEHASKTNSGSRPKDREPKATGGLTGDAPNGFKNSIEEGWAELLLRDE